MDFFEQLAGMCARELPSAMKANDADRVAAVIEGLATMQGRSIARAAVGNGAEIEKMLMASEAHAAAEAAGMAGVINLKKMMGRP